MEETKLYEWTCPCGKVIRSLYKAQFEFNMNIHKSICKKYQEAQDEE